VRSDAPDMDLMTVMCRARGYIERGGAEQSRGMARYARLRDGLRKGRAK
jgi:hypothetical protein